MKYYSDFYKTVDSDENAYFIGANTPRGFAYADPLLLNERNYKRLYIIKGGPGTGKSSMMKKCREHFEGMGAKVTSYYCSSDPDSLDAVIIKKNGISIAIADGTSPHALDASLPGAVSEIINLGEYWNSAALQEKYDAIAKASAEKALAFDSSRRYLAAADEILSTLRKASANGFEESKAARFIGRLISSLPRQRSNAERKTFITEAISMKGAFRLPAFEAAGTVFGIVPHTHLAPIFLEKLSNELERAGHSQHVSYSPLGEIAEIYLPIVDTAFVPVRCGMVYDKLIRLSRFADKEFFSGNMAKRRFNERCLLEVLDGALTSLAEAKKYHFALEDIYISAMDFKGIDEVCKRLIGEIEYCL